MLLIADGYPLCDICEESIMPDKKRAFIDTDESVSILCERCLRYGVERKHLPPELIGELI